MLVRTQNAAGVLLAALALASCSVSAPHGDGLEPGSGQELVALERPASAEGPFRVDRVVDGDTVRVLIERNSVRVRLIGLDTPETSHPQWPVQCFGQEATERARQLVSGKDVFLEYDATQGRQDRFGRELAYVWFDGDRMLNYEMVRDGFGHEYTFSGPYRYQELFREAQLEAEANDRGLWHPSTCDGVVE